MHKYTIGIILGLALLLFPYFYFNDRNTETNTAEETAEQASFTKAIISDQELSLEVVDTDETRTLGLSGREFLKEQTAMLFVYDEPQRAGIWMKDMNFEIDVLWLNSENEITYMVENMSPDSYRSQQDAEVYVGPELSSYVIEINAGFVEENSVEVGDSVELL